MKRRAFLQTSGLAAASMFVPKLIQASASPFLLPDTNGRILIVIQWSGGNDGLNTVVPFTNDLYYKMRPTLGLKKDQILTLTDDLGIHPKLLVLKNMFDNGELAIIENVGYPEPDRSHFRSMDIWQSASASNEYLSTGWIGRILDSGMKPEYALEIDDSLSLALKGQNKKGLAIRHMKHAAALSRMTAALQIEHHDHDQVSYLQQTLIEAQQGIEYLTEQTGKWTSQATYPINEFGQQLKSIAALINGGCKTTVYYVTLGGFDTHVGQPGTQNRLFDTYSQAINALRSDLKSTGRWTDVAILTFSEFGRRVSENAGKGTDHGTAGVSFIIGGNIKNPGLYGGLPDLENLDNGDLVYKVDFRTMYNALLTDWLKVGTDSIISKKISAIPLFV
jgi:uncharacterized protein (DUF1501 family)